MCKNEDTMSVTDILDTAQYVVDKDGRQTAVLLDVHSWQVLRHLLEEITEDDHLGKLMAEVADEETLTAEDARKAYEAYLSEA